MKTAKLFGTMLLAVLMLGACSKSQNPSRDIIGSWLIQEQNYYRLVDGSYELQRSYPGDGWCFFFREDGTFLEAAEEDPGDYDCLWRIKNDRVEFYDEDDTEASEQWIIVKLTDRELILKEDYGDSYAEFICSRIQ